jgi:homoserine/homoserine lactone efflux protein
VAAAPTAHLYDQDHALRDDSQATPSRAVSLEIWLAYVATVAVIVLLPGPSVLLAASRGLRHGLRGSLATVGGDLSANVLQMVAAGSGLEALSTGVPWILDLLKWLGVVYLAALGVRMARGSSSAVAIGLESGARRTPLELYLEGFGVSFANPKAILFFAGLFPAFLAADGSRVRQMLVLGLTFIALDGSALSLWACAARGLRREARCVARLSRIGGLALLTAAAGLAMK